MSRTVRNGLIASAAATLILAAGAGAVQAEPRPGLAQPGNWMHLVVLQGNGSEHHRLLRCPARVAEQPHSACAALKEVKGDIGKAAPLNTVCSMIYKPVTAIAYGMWDGERRAFSKSFASPCDMEGRTNGIFAAVRGVK